jgi:tricarballylate dehydrogenase
MPRSSLTCDVVVVGAGNAALTAAIAAHDHGAKVIVFEKATKELRGGDSRFSGGMFRFAYDSKEDIKPFLPNLTEKEWDAVVIDPYTPQAYYNDIMRVTQGLADPEMSRLIVDQSLETMRWMTTKLGIKWTWTKLWTVVIEGRRYFSSGALLDAEKEGIGLSDMLFKAAEERKINILYETRAVRLLMNSKGRVNGATILDKQGFHDVKAKAVILASGGFQSNPEMRVKYLGGDWNSVKVRGAKHNTGDMLREALDMGAKSTGHWAGCHATPIDGNAPNVGELSLTDRTNRLSYTYAIMVNVHGKRFIDEGEDLGSYTYAKIGRAVLVQTRSLTYQIFDQKTVGLLEPRYSTGTPIAGNTIEELADKLKIDRVTLVSTVKEFNNAVQEGKFDPSKKDGKSTKGIIPVKSNWALKIDSPPFVAYSATCGITFTFGGVSTNLKAQVLDVDDKVIPGLYAAGEITGFFYHNYPGGTGLMRGAIFGRISGTNAVQEE